MKTARTNTNMKNRVNAILIGTVLSLATCGVSHAMSELVSLSFEPEWPATTAPGTVILYKVSAVTRAGQGMLEVSLSSLGLPDGATVSFSPSVLRFTGHEPTIQTATMTVTCASVTPTETLPFTLTGEALRETVTLTNQVQQSRFSVISALPTLALDPLTGGSLRLRGKGATGQIYQIESTPSLSKPTWTQIGSSTADGNGRFTFTTAQAKDSPARFYRAACPVPEPPQE
jgi:hypothetical protein